MERAKENDKATSCNPYIITVVHRLVDKQFWGSQLDSCSGWASSEFLWWHYGKVLKGCPKPKGCSARDFLTVVKPNASVKGVVALKTYKKKRRDFHRQWRVEKAIIIPDKSVLELSERDWKRLSKGSAFEFPLGYIKENYGHRLFHVISLASSDWVDKTRYEDKAGLWSIDIYRLGGKDE